MGLPTRARRRPRLLGGSQGHSPDPKKNHLAVHVEDHPLSYIDFAGDIPEGNYGAGQVTVWDQGTYEELKWSDREVMVVLHGGRVEGRYVLFQTNGKNWMIHRMDPPQDSDREPMPERIEPMNASLAKAIPRNAESYGFEFKWDGIRALAFCSGGRVRLQSRSLADITGRYPELREMGEAIGSHELVLDGEIIAVGEGGRPSFELLQGRMGLTAEAEIRRKMKEIPVGYVIFDLLYRDGHSTMPLPYVERRRLLEELKLKGRFWQTPPSTPGDGEATLAASLKLGLEGVMAKRLDSTYQPGHRSDAWLKIKNHQGQELVIGGWLPGQGRAAAGSAPSWSATTTVPSLSMRARSGPASPRRCWTGCRRSSRPSGETARRLSGALSYPRGDLRRAEAGRRIRVQRVDPHRPSPPTFLQGPEGGQGPADGRSRSAREVRLMRLSADENQARDADDVEDQHRDGVQS